jgi:hypothetical protein
MAMVAHALPRRAAPRRSPRWLGGLETGCAPPPVSASIVDLTLDLSAARAARAS